MQFRSASTPGKSTGVRIGKRGFGKPKVSAGTPFGKKRTGYVTNPKQRNSTVIISR